MRRIAVLIGSTAIGAGAAGTAYPPSVYPPPVEARPGGGLAACPNQSGLETFGVAATRLAVGIADTYDRHSLRSDLRNSDRAWWPEVRRTWRSGKPGRGVTYQVVYGSEPLSRSGYSVIVRSSCGSALVAKSLLVNIGPRQTHPPYCEACISQLFFVDRRGRALIYYLY